MSELVPDNQKRLTSRRSAFRGLAGLGAAATLLDGLSGEQGFIHPAKAE